MLSQHFIADRYGRKASFYLLWCTLLIAVCLQSFGTNWKTWLVAKCGFDNYSLETVWDLDLRSLLVPSLKVKLTSQYSVATALEVCSS
jgi:hypothetical protein